MEDVRGKMLVFPLRFLIKGTIKEGTMRQKVEKKIENLLDIVNDNEVVIVLAADMKDKSAGSGHVGDMAEVMELLASFLLRPQSEGDDLDCSDDVIQMCMYTAIAAANIRTKGAFLERIKKISKALDESGLLIDEDEFNDMMKAL
jgi:hypothetical protein